jgi:hypothetical protein
MARPVNDITFWDRVNVHTEVQVNGCILFKGNLDDCGYGRITRDGNLVRVHREVWKLHNPNQEITGVIMHLCDAPNCINPEHLSQGTQAENVADMRTKGRGRYLTGSQQSQAKLDENKVLIIKDKLAIGVTCARLARDFDVSESAIRNIKMGRRWTHVK